jgi:type VI secretion system protein ImpH
MAYPSRRSDINIEPDILENGEAYDFFQAVKLLKKISGSSRIHGGRSGNIRIEPELNLDYPQSDIAEINKLEGDNQYQITTTFFGLYGVSSPLPGFYTEELLDDEWDELENRKNFLDVIHNHLYPLLYQAWLKYKFPVNTVEFESKKYWEIIFSLIGLPAAFRQDQAQYGYLLRYSGILSQRSKSMLGLQTILSDYFQDLGVQVQPCVERVVPIVSKQRCFLGQNNHQLGQNSCIGQEVADRTGKFNILLGPVDKVQFEKILSENKAIKFIKSILTVYLTQPLEFNVILILKKQVLQSTQLGQSNWSALGQSTWLLAQSNTTEVRQVIYES